MFPFEPRFVKAITAGGTLAAAIGLNKKALSHRLPTFPVLFISLNCAIAGQPSCQFLLL